MSDDKIKVFDSDDQRLKTLGEILSSDTARKIIKLLMREELYVNAIAKKLDIRVSLVVHHMNKMRDVGILEVNHKKIVRKGKDHSYYKMIKGIFVMPNESIDITNNENILKKYFKEGIKFFSIFGTSILSHFFIEENSQDSWYHTSQDWHFIPYVIVIIGLGALLVFEKRKRK